MTDKLELRLYTSAVGVYLTARGRLDSTTAHQLGRAIGVALDRYPTDRLTVDVAALDAIDAAGISVLMLFRTSALQRGVHLTVADPPPHIRAVIRALRADQLLAAAFRDLPGGASPRHRGDRRRSIAVPRHCLRPSTAARRRSR
ncbi:STAS domain-containing protein [Catellatospora sichuanensis]|uniref:STAS domain-containing protein n=1 Tax=Catellatospora sichuanensis TaxID=1969805 RepID=UPI001183C9E8|nr:STAS domain-containing protein [Catellatospora sichuanensis]